MADGADDDRGGDPDHQADQDQGGLKRLADPSNTEHGNDAPGYAWVGWLRSLC